MLLFIDACVSICVIGEISFEKEQRSQLEKGIHENKKSLLSYPTVSNFIRLAMGFWRWHQTLYTGLLKTNLKTVGILNVNRGIFCIFFKWKYIVFTFLLQTSVKLSTTDIRLYFFIIIKVYA